MQFEFKRSYTSSTLPKTFACYDNFVPFVNIAKARNTQMGEKKEKNQHEKMIFVCGKEHNLNSNSMRL